MVDGRGRGSKSLLDGIDVLEVIGEREPVFKGISQNSKAIKPGYIFVARKGERSDGWDFIEDAKKRGATAVVTDREVREHPGITVIRVRDVHQALTVLSCQIYGNPSQKLKLIGFTGTNGKTTSSWLMHSVLESAGYRCGLMGTIGYLTGGERQAAPLTTPDSDQINATLAEMVDSGLDWAVIEVSSHALALDRVDGLSFIAAGFTNLTREHQDFHASLEDYAGAKAKLFRMLPAHGLAIVNQDDPWSRVMIEASAAPVITYGGRSRGADLFVSILEHDLSGGRYRLTWKDDSFEISSPLVGVYHGFNIALCAATALGLGIDAEAVIEGVGKVRSVEGRMEPVKMGQEFSVLVDYSHTPDALENALKSARELCRGRLISVFGCGGNRDRRKRPEMGWIASEYADLVVVTSDNPRFEEPKAITDEIIEGIPLRKRGKLIVEADRRKAISHAIHLARKDDLVLISGKGHETYQILEGVRHAFDDRLVAAEALRKAGFNK